MNLNHLFENDSDHAKALKKNGYWGARAAGCIFLAKDTKRILLSHRSPYVEQPNTWSGWGGAIDKGENPEMAVRREAEEETGYHGPIEFIPLYVFVARKADKIVFKYFNYLAVIPSEFTPRLDWESQGYQWCEFNNWPKPLHFGTIALFDDRPSLQVIEAFLGPDTQTVAT